MATRSFADRVRDALADLFGDSTHAEFETAVQAVVRVHRESQEERERMKAGEPEAAEYRLFSAGEPIGPIDLEEFLEAACCDAEQEVAIRRLKVGEELHFAASEAEPSYTIRRVCPVVRGGEPGTYGDA